MQEFYRTYPISHEVTLEHGTKAVSAGAMTFTTAQYLPHLLVLELHSTRKGDFSYPSPPLSQVSALGMDPSGARVITGGYDYDVKLWDFAGMDSRLQSFRCITPCERSVVSPRSLLLVSRSTCKVKGQNVRSKVGFTDFYVSIQNLVQATVT